MAADGRWDVTVDGADADVDEVIIAHPRFGVLRYGDSGRGYHGWTFRENGGGGVVILPWAVVRGALHVGLLRQDRPNQGGVVLNAPRGFVEPGEDPGVAAARELEEETGLSLPVTRLPGDAYNPNSTFFVTRGDGVTPYAAEVPADRLVEGPAGVGLRGARHDEDEGIRGIVFVPWRDALVVGDMFTVATVARLVASREG